MLIQISAGDLSEFCFPQGSLGVMPSVDRMFEGTRAHKKLQNLYKEDENIKYQHEVPLEIILNYPEFDLKIQGRADGIFFDKKDYFIHEIKSTYNVAETIEKPLKLAHKAQMMIYAYIFAKEQHLSQIKCRLSYFCLIDEQIVDFDYTFDFSALEAFLTKMADEYSSLIKSRLDSQKELKKTAKELVFPFEKFRRGQREGAAQIYSAIVKNKNLFLQAPTGTGKTAMALFPAVKYLADDSAKIFCFSAKNQTMTVTRQALDLMRKKGLKIKSCTISAKSKCCPMEIQDCSPEKCPYSLDYFEKLHKALPETLEEDDYSPENIKAFSEKYQICPYELSLELSLESHVIICDYNYLFDPVVYLRRFFDFDDKYIFLIDEAHNLIDRGRDMYSFTLYQKDLREIKKLFPKEHKLYKSFSKILTQLNKLIKSYKENGVLDDIKNLIFAILNNNDAINEVSQKSVVPIEAVFFQKELIRFVTLTDFFDCELFKFYANDTSLILECIDPSKMLENSIKKSFSTVLYSATLTPYEFYKNSILPESEVFGFSSPYPFDEKNLTVLADYSVDTRYNNREKYFEIIAQKIEKIKNSAKGNIMVYFPSYKFMNEVALFLEDQVIIQPADMDSTSREDFLNNFTPESNICAFAVMGSHFGEGIDIKNLKGIVIVGVALPQFNEARSHIQEHFEKKYQKGFEYAYVYPGINKVCQASGRLIRNENDKGFIILMDNRFRNYKNLLPEHWNIKEIKNYDDLNLYLQNQ